MIKLRLIHSIKIRFSLVRIAVLVDKSWRQMDNGAITLKNYSYHEGYKNNLCFNGIQ